MTNVRRLSGIALALSLGSWGTANADVVTEWNAVTLSCVQGPVNANRSGPAGLLDIAIIQAAVHDAVQAIEGRFEPYEYENPAMRGVGSPEAAAASAAYQTLKGLYGADDPCLANVTDPAITYAGDAGLQAGVEAASALLPHYRPTLTLPTDPFLGSEEPGQWRPTPNVTHGAGTFLAVTAPFAMTSPSQFRPAPPPRLKSLRYARDYYEVKKVGASASSARTQEQTDAAQFWTSNFFSQWNAALRQLAGERVPNLGDKARLFALTSFAAADSQISVYETKYVYNYWRPITAIQEGDFDGNLWTIGDPTWTPLIQTPPYPEYTSGANCLTASISSVLRGFFGSDNVQLTFSSTAAGQEGKPRTYQRLSELEKEMVGVRVWQGIHFRTAEEKGVQQGRQIGSWTYEKYLRPLQQN